MKRQEAISRICARWGCNAAEASQLLGNGEDRYDTFYRYHRLSEEAFEELLDQLDADGLAAEAAEVAEQDTSTDRRQIPDRRIQQDDSTPQQVDPTPEECLTQLKLSQLRQLLKEAQHTASAAHKRYSQAHETWLQARDKANQLSRQIAMMERKHLKPVGEPRKTRHAEAASQRKSKSELKQATKLLANLTPEQREMLKASLGL